MISSQPYWQLHNKDHKADSSPVWRNDNLALDRIQMQSQPKATHQTSTSGNLLWATISAFNDVALTYA